MAYVGHNHDQAYVRKNHFGDFGVVLTGTTSATAGTPVAVPHNLGFAPLGAVVLVGDAYVVSVDATNVNVASRGTSQAFTVGVVRG